jgi:hypothetical protein
MLLTVEHIHKQAAVIYRAPILVVRPALISCMISDGSLSTGTPRLGYLMRTQHPMLSSTDMTTGRKTIIATSRY